MKKRLATAIILMIIVYMSACGNYISAGMTDDLAYLYGLIDFLIISLIMMSVPLTLKLLNKITIENGKKICKWNSIIIFIISVIMMVTIQISFVGGLGAVAYYFINVNLFVNDKNNFKPKNKETSENIISDDKWQQYLEKHYKATGTRTNMQLLKNNQYENQRNNFSNNKNYKILFTIIIVILTIGLILSIHFNITYRYKIDDLKSLLDHQEDVSSSWSRKYFNLSDKVTFYDKHIVFIIDGYGDYYYTYDCMKKVTSGKKFSFLAYNVDSAIAKGYKEFKCSN